MAATEAVVARSKRSGMAALAPAQGLDVLAALMAAVNAGRPLTQVAAVPADWSIILKQVGLVAEKHDWTAWSFVHGAAVDILLSVAAKPCVDAASSVAPKQGSLRSLMVTFTISPSSRIPSTRHSSSKSSPPPGGSCLLLMPLLRCSEHCLL